MTPLQFAMLFNVTGTAIVVVLSLAVLLMGARPFYRFWTLGFTCGLMATMIELTSTWAGWQTPLILAITFSAWPPPGPSGRQASSCWSARGPAS